MGVVGNRRQRRGTVRLPVLTQFTGVARHARRQLRHRAHSWHSTTWSYAATHAHSSGSMPGRGTRNFMRSSRMRARLFRPATTARAASAARCGAPTCRRGPDRTRWRRRKLTPVLAHHTDRDQLDCATILDELAVVEVAHGGSLCPGSRALDTARSRGHSTPCPVFVEGCCGAQPTSDFAGPSPADDGAPPKTTWSPPPSSRPGSSWPPRSPSGPSIPVGFPGVRDVGFQSHRSRRLPPRRRRLRGRDRSTASCRRRSYGQQLPFRIRRSPPSWSPRCRGSRCRRPARCSPCCPWPHWSRRSYWALASVGVRRARPGVDGARRRGGALTLEAGQLDVRLRPGQHPADGVRGSRTV